jgi:cardiolipin synthase
MLAAIAGARRAVAMTSYIFRDDAAGKEFAEALIAAKARGVKVCVLLDSVGIGYFFPKILYRLQAGGVVAARFLHTWLPWRMPFLNMRNHRKLLVVDGATAFIGGMNIGAENSKRLDPKNFITDIHFRVQGPVVRQAMEAFARDWSFTTGENLDEDFWWPDLAAVGAVHARGLRSGPDADIFKLELILGAALTLAKKRIRILTPYFLPDARLQFAIAQACLRGVEVDIVIPEHGNYLIMDWAMRAHLRFSNHIAANIFTTPLPFDHSKLCTLDGAWCLIGSSNWDARSFRLNFEFDLECYDPALVNVLDDIIDAKIARGTRLEIRALIARPVWIRLRDAAARLMMPYL